MLDPRYWFMLPISMVTAIAANQSGIGGAAVFGPIFIILFPLFGPEYPLASPAAAVSTAILVEIFGFSSGVLGFLRRGLIDPRLVLKTSIISVPLTILASLFVKIPVFGLKIIYTLLMLALGAFFYYLSRHSQQDNQQHHVDFIPTAINPLSSERVGGSGSGSFEIHTTSQGPTDLETSGNAGIASSSSSTSSSSSLAVRYPLDLSKLLFGQKEATTPTFRTQKERQGDKVHRYVNLPLFDLGSILLSASGGFFVALIGVGLGEVMVPRFQYFGLPVEISSAASATALAVTCLFAATVQFSALIKSGGFSAVPWDLIVWMIPGVIIGAQIGTYYVGFVKKQTMQRVIGGFFFFIGLLFLAVVIKTEQ